MVYIYRVVRWLSKFMRGGDSALLLKFGTRLEFFLDTPLPLTDIHNFSIGPYGINNMKLHNMWEN